MKTSSPSFFPPAHHFIDTAPLMARYNILTAAILLMIDAGRLGRALRLSHDVNHVIRLFVKFETRNTQLKMKLKMLLCKPWRTRVLKQLGGMRRLRSWEAAAARNAKPRKETGHNFDADPVWLNTPERRAESERLKAHVKKCARACVSPNVVRDRIRMDFEGQFRLAPIPQGERHARQEKIYTAGSICDYVFNAVPFYEAKGFGPAVVWPAEFRAAIAAEEKLEAELKAEAESEADVQAGANLSAPQPSPLTDVSPDIQKRYEWVDEGDEGYESFGIPTYSYRNFIPPKLQHRLFPPLA
jgi:hypothetical protein